MSKFGAPAPIFHKQHEVVDTLIACGGQAVSGSTHRSIAVGDEAGFTLPQSVCYSSSRDALLIADSGYDGIRCLLRSAASVDRLLTSILFESGVLPIDPLISIIADYANRTSKCFRACVHPHSVYGLPNVTSHHSRAVWVICDDQMR